MKRALTAAALMLLATSAVAGPPDAATYQDYIKALRQQRENAADADAALIAELSRRLADWEKYAAPLYSIPRN